MDVIKKKWKSLRDNFRAELKKVPIGKSGDPGLPIDQYLSKWPYFKRMFFIRDSMIGRKMSRNLTMAMTIGEPEQNTSSCTSLALSHQSTAEVYHALKQDTTPSESGALTRSRKKRMRVRESMDNETEKLLDIEREKVEIEKQKLQLLIQDNERKEKEENDFDRLFLLTLLPSLKKIPEKEKTNAKIKLQRVLHEAIYGYTDDTSVYRPWEN